MATISLRNINPARFDYDVHMMSSVGIGTTVPDHSLEIDGGSGTDLLHLNSSAPILKVTATNNSSGLRINTVGQSAGQLLRVQDDGTTMFQIDYDGKVGIGTTSPGKLLELSNAEPVIRMSSSSGKQYDIASGGGVGTTANDFAIINQSDGGTAFRIKGGSSSDGALAINAGKVGIGTDAPDHLLEIDGGSGTDLLHLNSSAPILKVTATNNSSGLRINTVGQSAGQLLRVQDDGTTMFQIDYDGKVGIGTTSPAQKLEVAGNIRVDNKIEGKATTLILDTETATTNGILFRTAGSEKMRVHYDGKVGIGTNAPAGELHVKSIDGSTNSIILERAGSSAQAVWNYNDPDSTIGTTGSDGFKIFTNNTVRMTIQSDGKVGIGTITPAHPLEVNGAIKCNSLQFADGTTFSSVSQVGMKAIAVNIGNGSSNIVGRAKSVVDASYGGITNGMVIVYYYYYYTYGCGNGTCGAYSYVRYVYNVVNGTWNGMFSW